MMTLVSAPPLDLHPVIVPPKVADVVEPALVVDLLHTSDSMAWSYHARKNGRSANDWREAKRFVDKIETMPYQESLL